MKKWLALFLFLAMPYRSWATMTIEVEGGSMTDTDTTTAVTNENNNIVVGNVMWQISEHFHMGWSYLSFYQSQSGASKEVYQSRDTGPVLAFEVGKSVAVTAEVGYNIWATATYQTGVTNYTYTGSSVYGVLTASAHLGDWGRIGLGVLTYGATFTSYTNMTSKVVYNYGATKTTSVPLLSLAISF